MTPLATGKDMGLVVFLPFLVVPIELGLVHAIIKMNMLLVHDKQHGITKEFHTHILFTAVLLTSLPIQ